MTQSAPHAAPPSSLAPGPELQTEFDFFTLARPVQDRFVASSNGTGMPKAVLFRAAPQSRALLWLGAGVAIPCVLILLMLAGFAEVESPLAIQSPFWGLVYVLLCAAEGMCVHSYLAERNRPAAYPYRLGHYLFPVGVVVANDEHLKIYPLKRLRELKVSAGKAVFSFPGERFTFTLPPGLTPDQLRSDVAEYQERFAAALAGDNRRELAVLDPIRDSGFSNPLSSAEPISKSVGKNIMKLGLALTLGVALGALLFAVRNKVAERSLYKAVREQNTSAAYQAYLDYGGKRPEVVELLLPRAELRDTRGSLDAVEAYSRTHPDSKIRVEIDGAIREELLAELKHVRKLGTLKAVSEFKAKHAGHHLVRKELEQARHAVFTDAIDKYVDQAKAGLKIQEFFEELIRYSEEHGPRVEVRFRQYVPPSVERADNLLRRSAYFAGTKSLPSQYFSKKYSRQREQEAMAAILEKLQSRFSPEILSFSAMDTLEGRGDLPKVDVPTLFMSYKIEMSGAYTTQRPRGVFVGLGMMVRTDFVIPGREKPLSLRKHSSWLPPEPTKIWKEQLTPEQVYNQNAKEGFDRYVKRVLEVFVPETLLPEGAN